MTNNLTTQRLLKQIGANIRRQRAEKGMTQEKLAELVDLNIRTVQKIEAGDINMLVTTSVRVRRALGCPWDKVLPQE